MHVFSLDVQITECEDGSLQFKVDAPGLAKDDFKIEVSPDNVLTISGEVSLDCSATHTRTHTRTCVSIIDLHSL